MRVYFDTGVFIDYLSTRGSANVLRSSARRGRTPAEIVVDAERLFELVGRAHIGATSCLTYYEAEEALYRHLAQSAKRVAESMRHFGGAWAAAKRIEEGVLAQGVK